MVKLFKRENTQSDKENIWGKKNADNIVLNGERLKRFFSKSRNKKVSSLSPLLFNFLLDSSYNNQAIHTYVHTYINTQAHTNQKERIKNISF